MTTPSLTRDQLVELVYESCMWKLHVWGERLEEELYYLNEECNQRAGHPE